MIPRAKHKLRKSPSCTETSPQLLMTQQPQMQHPLAKASALAISLVSGRNDKKEAFCLKSSE